MQSIKTFLMFEGNAKKAIDFYIDLFEQSEIVSISYYDKDGPGKEGTVKHATFMLKGQAFMAIDSYVNHGFSFTPAMSLYLTVENEDEIDYLFKQLSEDGQVLMSLTTYPFSKKYCWLTDKFGVSWQLSLSN